MVFIYWRRSDGLRPRLGWINDMVEAEAVLRLPVPDCSVPIVVSSFLYEQNQEQLEVSKFTCQLFLSQMLDHQFLFSGHLLSSELWIHPILIVWSFDRLPSSTFCNRRQCFKVVLSWPSLVLHVLLISFREQISDHGNQRGHSLGMTFLMINHFLTRIYLIFFPHFFNPWWLTRFGYPIRSGLFCLDSFGTLTSFSFKINYSNIKIFYYKDEKL